jgi:hypothetical protein
MAPSGHDIVVGEAYPCIEMVLWTVYLVLGGECVVPGHVIVGG